MHGSAAMQTAAYGPFLIPTAHWRDANGILVSDLWRTGQITIWSWWAAGSKKVQYDYFNVRFEPRSLLRMLQEAGIESAVLQSGAPPKPEARTPKLPKSASSPPTISRPALEKWFAAYAADNPNWKKGATEKAAASHFPGHHVPRQMVRDVIGPRERGRPIIRR
jgi:hypothetical protein